MRTDIRPPEEVEKWRKKDPLKTFEECLLNHYDINAETLHKIKMDVAAEVAAAHVFAKNSPYPDRRDLLNDIFR